MSSQVLDSSIASLSQGGDPLGLRDKPVSETANILASGAARRKAAFWDRIFRRKVRRVPKGAEPVCINKAADAARARDALRSRDHEIDERARQLQSVRGSGWKDTQALEKAWQDGADCWGPNWEAGGLKWKAKARWG